MLVVDLNATLMDLSYPVTRKLTVPEHIRLTDLHLVLQAAMGWENEHLYDFTCGSRRSMHRWAVSDSDWASEFDHKLKTGTLADILAVMGKQKSFTYTYDMGDSWELELRPSAPRAAEAGFALLEAVGTCPPEDSGGAPGFSYMLECLDDPAHENHEEYLEWMGDEPFDRNADLAVLAERVAFAARKLAKRYKS